MSKTLDKFGQSELKCVVDGLGPITHCELIFPPGGVGVMIVTGTHGTGKDFVVEAIARIVTGNKKYTASVNDNAEKARVTIAGGGISVGQKIVPIGECEYVGIDPKLIEELMNPPYSGEEPAERHRIQMLVDLAKVPASCDAFRDLCEDNDEYEEVCTEEMCSCSSMVEMCETFARRMNAKALTTEKEAAQEAANAVAKRGATSDLDLTAECDGKVLELRLAQAMQAEADLRAADRAAEQAAASHIQSQLRLSEAEANYTGKTVEQATADYLVAADDAKFWGEKVAAIRTALAEAEKQLTDHKVAVDAAIAAGKAARQHEETVAAWRESVNSAIPPRPAAEELAKAAQIVQDARKAVETGALVRRAKEQAGEVLGHAERAEALKKKAERLREAAKGTDDILSQAVAKANCPLKVYRGRLVMKTDRSERERFTDLSGGEKLLVALEIALRTVPKGKKALLPITPRTWGELNSDSEHRIAEMARENGVLIVTGRCTVDPVLGAVTL